MPRPSLESSGPIFRSAAQAAVLHRLVREPGAWLDLGDFDDAGLPRLTIRRELTRLVAAGIVARDATVRPHRFRVDAAASLTPHLAAVVAMTIGVDRLLAAELITVEFVRSAAIYGSWAGGEATPTSDVDLLVVVEDDSPSAAVDLIRDAARRAEQVVGRDIDTAIFARSELRDRYLAGSGFVRAVMESPRIDLVGDVEAEVAEVGRA